MRVGPLWQDVRFATRSLIRTPGATAVATLTLALGIGANTAVFSVVDAVVLRPLPFPRPEELVRVWEVNSRGVTLQAAWRNFLDWRVAAGFEGLAAHGRGGPSTVLGLEDPIRPSVAPVSEGFFRVLAVEAALGRTFLPEEHRRGGDPAVVVSHRFWRSRLGGETDLERHRLVVAGLEARVVGVMPEGFAYPEGVELWYPMELHGQSESRTAHNWLVLGRLAPGASLQRATSELDVITAGFLEADPGAGEEEGFQEFFPRAARVVPLHEALVGDTRRALWILLGAAFFVLLVACTNLASAALARGAARESELAVRQALGAGRRRLVRLLTTESLVLAGAGSVAGLALAALLVRLLPAFAPTELPRLDEVGLNGRVLGFAIAVSAGTVLLFGLLPALRLTRADVSRALRSGPRGTWDRRRQRVWSGLIVAEVALALVLLVGAGLLLRSFREVIGVDAGFDTGSLTVTLSPPSSKYGDLDARRSYYDRVLAELEALPGVADAGLVTHPPFAPFSSGLVRVADGAVETVTAVYQVASPGVFRALGIRLLRGRGFEPADHEGTGHVVLVSEGFAERAWPGEEPVGKRMTGGGMDDYWDQDVWATVVGVVADLRQRSLTRPPDPTFYFSYRQRPFRAGSMVAVLRPERGDPISLAGPARDALRRVDPDVPAEFATMGERLRRSVAERRFTLLLLGSFASVALVLAVVGIYGVVSYSVARRRRELGIRMALGATPPGVRRMVQRQILGLAALGAIVGGAAALALTRVLESLLYEVKPWDPLTFFSVVFLLGAAAWAASLLPSLRGSRVDPQLAMRVE